MTAPTTRRTAAPLPRTQCFGAAAIAARRPGPWACVWLLLIAALPALADEQARAAADVQRESVAAAEAQDLSLEARLAQLEALAISAAQEREQLSEQDRELREQAAPTGAFAALSTQLEKQGRLLTRLAEKLGLSADGAGDDGRGGGADSAARGLIDENARLREELEVSKRRLGLLIDQFAKAHQLRLEAVAEAAAAREQGAELEARLRQRRQAEEEALMRADKAEKLYAALEEAHLRVTTENERLARDLQTAKQRQADALRRVVELDRLLATAEARDVRIVSSEDGDGLVAVDDSGQPLGAGGPDVLDEQQANAAAADQAVPPAAPVLYEVRGDDTLSLISAKVYGEASEWRRIFDANRDRLETPDDLELGMRLIIP